MKLNDRMHLIGLLPTQGNFETLIIAKDIRAKIEISQEELKEFEMKTVDNFIQWNALGMASDKDIEFTEAEKTLIASQLTEKSEKKELTNDMIDLYTTFVTK